MECKTILEGLSYFGYKLLLLLVTPVVNCSAV